MPWKLLFGLFLIVHGLIHLMYVSPAPVQQPGKAPWPFSLTKSWLSLPPETLKTIGLILVILAVVGYIVCGVGVIITSSPNVFIYWLGIIASIFSIILMAIFWDKNFVVGISLSIAILIWFASKLLK